MTFEGVFQEKWHANTLYLMLITGINMIVEGVFKEKWHVNTVYLMLITGINMIVEGVFKENCMLIQCISC